MTKAQSLIISALAITLSGCAGMNSDFEFDKPAKDSGVWMAQADDMSAGGSGNAPSATSGASSFTGAGIHLDEYRLIDTGTIHLDPQTVMPAGRSGQNDDIPVRVASSGEVRPFTRENGVLRTDIRQTAYCSAVHCFPEPAAAFRRPDGVARIWIAPYVSPDNNVHMGEVIYSVSSRSDWSGILM
ncbi:type IV conjugative transfer system protein TraV [Candidatus Pantoea deserta]|uniref:Type IV conjugative transfer system protein TraV n=1 Tax=Candidatus Pantoea deserta TaxID=1869313 RepID=A0A3N4NX89_9GAMM|nr:type IV conjugative transfer system lipoprotein TraV [Pantoea deserta]RPD91743.1 type IV conjugative transfer system protein TraV [Pantoea deserta]